MPNAYYNRNQKKRTTSMNFDKLKKFKDTKSWVFSHVYSSCIPFKILKYFAIFKPYAVDKPNIFWNIHL